MRKSEPRHLYPSPLPLLESALASNAAVMKNAQKEESVKETENMNECYTDLVTHSDMSWGSLEDRYIPHEIPSDDGSIRASSSGLSFSSSDWNNWTTATVDEEKRSCIMENPWSRYSLDTSLWENENAPVVRVRDSKEMLYDDLEFCGFCTDRIIGLGLSHLTKSPGCGRYVLSKCVLKNKSIHDITIFNYHRYLQYIDLSYNHISQLGSLGGIPYLMYLDVSHNRIRHVLRFKPPWYLTHVNLSYNHIVEIDDISDFWSLVQLDLSHNAIEVISGLQNLKYLQYLNLSYNLIECIENLDNLNIEELYLEGNCISSFKSKIPDHGINVLPNLRKIILGYNRLSCLEFFKDSYGLRVVDLRFNKISDLLEVAHLKGPIREIDLRGNSCVNWPNYRDVILFTLSDVNIIDGSEVVAAEKISAALLFASPLDLAAARTVTKLTTLEQLNAPRIGLHVNPYDESRPPLIVLTGPSAVKKVALAQHVALKLPKNVKYCPWHCTRELEDNEHEERSYIFTNREDFNNITRRGDFLALQELLGNSYGFHQDQIAALVREGKVGITQMDLNATLQLSRRYSNIKPILVLTNSEDVHRAWIQEKFDVFTWMKNSVENLFAVKIGKHAEAVSSESTNSEISFIDGILKQIIKRLDLPSYSEHVRPQSNGATATDIIEESKTMLPKVVVTRSEIEEEEKRHIKFQEFAASSTNSQADRRKFIPMGKSNTKGLRVILDEESNIIIDDKESKRKRQRARILYRRGTLEIFSSDMLISDEPDESLSSEDALIDVPEANRSEDPRRSEHLKNMYTELVMKSRKIYLDHHNRKPGFFRLVLLTDNYVKAFNALADFTYETHALHTNAKSTVTPEMKYYTEIAIPSAIKTMTNEIRTSSSTTLLQRRNLLRNHGMISWKNLMPSQISKPSPSFT